MRLWHYALIPHLPRQQLLGQHRECCALRGKGWGKKHATVDYVFTHPYSWLFSFHLAVMMEMQNRGYCPAKAWWAMTYRGHQIGFDGNVIFGESHKYPEHNDAYLQECLENLRQKGVVIHLKKETT